MSIESDDVFLFQRKKELYRSFFQKCSWNERRFSLCWALNEPLVKPCSYVTFTFRWRFASTLIYCIYDDGNTNAARGFISILCIWICTIVKTMQNLTQTHTQALTLTLYSDRAKANTKARMYFDVCRLFFDLFRFHLAWIGSKSSFILKRKWHLF